LDIVFSGDLGNVGDNPFRLRSTNGRLRVGLEFDAPLTRLAERNVYRQSLIEYQQARRSYYQFRDRIHQGIRNTLRQLGVDDLNFELRRAAVHVAITQVDLARLRLSEPARPVQATAPGQPTQPGGASQFGDTVARDLVNALIDLLNVQNDFLSVWVDQEVQRMQLDFDLGIMELDVNGVRIEHQQSLRSYLESLPCTVPWELPNYCDGVAPVPGSLRPGSSPSIQLMPLLPPSGPEFSPTPAMPRGTDGTRRNDSRSIFETRQGFESLWLDKSDQGAAREAQSVMRASTWLPQSGGGGVVNAGEVRSTSHLVPVRLPLVDDGTRSGSATPVWDANGG
jgi:hypothetical protein